MISIILSSRKDGNINPFASLTDFLRNLTYTAEKYDTFEVFVKIDDDDEGNKKVIETFKDYPFKIKPIIYPRCLGYECLHWNYVDLFLESSGTSSRDMVWPLCDDARMSVRNWDTIIHNIANTCKTDVFIISAQYLERDSMFDAVNRSESFPVFSCGIVYAMNGFGPKWSIDSFLQCTRRILETEYGIDIAAYIGGDIAVRYEPNTPDPSRLRSKEKMLKFYENTHMMSMCRAQAKNIALHIKEQLNG